MAINIREFANRFADEYEFLYEHQDRVAGYGEAVRAFDEFFPRHREFVMEFVRYRGDCVTSDREAAAFMFALDAMVA